MDKAKIEKLEEEIKNLHYNPKIVSHNLNLSEDKIKELFKEFWDFHVKPVVQYSNEMALKYDADLEAVWLGALLHDIARLEDKEPHDEIGSETAYEILIKNGFSRELAEKVKGIVLTHRCKKYPPETLEQKIIASADAMAHFLQPFYAWLNRYHDKPFSEIILKNAGKIERDYNEKIFFEDEKKGVSGQYETLRGWFNRLD
jgi:putative nucleotidyltransferase with HDIG domain